jgi:hypothetical protein
VKRTSPLNLVLTAAFGGFVAWFGEAALVTSGRPSFVPPVTLAVALVLIAVIIVAMAVPVNRVARGTRKYIDPFYATRVVVLAKASSVTGALLGGVGLGVAGFLLTRSVVPGVGSVGMAFAMSAGAIVLLAAGLVAEAMCAIPPEDDDKKPDTTVTSQGTT